MNKVPPLKDKKLTIKEEYLDKIDRLKFTIQNAINSFEKDSGCTVTFIRSNYDYGAFTFDIVTDILGIRK